MMFLLILVTTIAAVSAALVWTTIAHDGLGVRPAPRSHRNDDFGVPFES